MSGFGFDDDELKKLFAEAGEVVRKARPSGEKQPEKPSDTLSAPSEPAASMPPPAPIASPAPEPVNVTAPAPSPAEEADWSDTEIVAPRPVAPAPAVAQAGAVRLVGGEQDAAALVGRTAAGATVRMAWSDIRALSVARVGERCLLAFACKGEAYYFSDENVAYKGLLKQMATTLALNWRTLIQEIGSHVADRSDVGLQALTGGGGMIPRFSNLPDFLRSVASRAG
jgi:hypothetical protein